MLFRSYSNNDKLLLERYSSCDVEEIRSNIKKMDQDQRNYRINNALLLENLNASKESCIKKFQSYGIAIGPGRAKLLTRTQLSTILEEQKRKLAQKKCLLAELQNSDLFLEAKERIIRNQVLFQESSRLLELSNNAKEEFDNLNSDLALVDSALSKMSLLKTEITENQTKNEAQERRYITLSVNVGIRKLHDLINQFLSGDKKSEDVEESIKALISTANDDSQAQISSSKNNQIIVQQSLEELKKVRQELISSLS